MDSPQNDAQQDKPAWLRLYLARRAQQPAPTPSTRPVGRPSRAIPTKQTSVWLSAGDRELLGNWQRLLEKLAGSSISLGETVAILTRICDDRLNALGGGQRFGDLAEFTLRMIGSPAEQGRPEDE